MKWNAWKKAYNYLLVEKLVSKCEEEAWREVATMVDQSATFETESMKCQAARKYACYYEMPVESVKMEDVVNSPRGVRGWCEMQITVPGINDKDTGASEQPETQAGSKKAKKQAKKRGGDSTAGAPGEDQASEPAPKAAAKTKGEKPKKEQTEVQKNEDIAKTILAQLQRSQQIMAKVSGHGDALPTEWKWALPFLQDYQSLCVSFEDALTPSGGDDLKDFIDEMKLSSIDKKNMKQFKAVYKDRYGSLLALFADRCSTIAAQQLLPLHSAP